MIQSADDYFPGGGPRAPRPTGPGDVVNRSPASDDIPRQVPGRTLTGH